MSSSSKLVSIIIPTYNSSEFIKKTLLSCISQDYNNIEIIVSDDGSTDDTIKKIRMFHNVKLIASSINYGLAKNINAATRIAKGEYLLILGHDDCIPENHISKMMEFASKETSIIHCNAICVDENGNFIKWKRQHFTQEKKSKNPLYYLAIENFIQSCGAMVNAKYYRKVGGWDESYKYYGEWLLWIKLASIGNVRYVKNTHGIYKFNQGLMKSLRADVRHSLIKYQEECKHLAMKKISSKGERILVKIRIKYVKAKSYLSYKRKILR